MGSFVGGFRIPEDLMEDRAEIHALVQLLIRRGVISQHQFEAKKREILEEMRGHQKQTSPKEG